MPKTLLQISEAESAVMEILWRRSPLAAEEVVSALDKSHDWQEATIKTLLNRLLKKKAIRAEKDGRRYLYLCSAYSYSQWKCVRPQ